VGAGGTATIADEEDLFLSSPYVRAIQTAEMFASAFAYAKEKIRKMDLLLPGSDVGALFREIAKNKDAESVFCFGHGPHLDEVIAAALGSKRDATSLKRPAWLALSCVASLRRRELWRGWRRRSCSKI
jgi:phosphohistidine phosphatase SixA